TNADCMLYKDGKEHMRIITPQAVWQNGHLTADHTARLESADGTMKADAERATWFQQVTTMYQTHATMYQKGEKKVVITAPEAIQKDDQVIANKTAHAESPDGLMKLDGQTAVYNQTSGLLHMTDTHGQQYKNGKVYYTAEGPVADYQNDILTMPTGGLARRVDDGGTVRGDVVHWNHATGAVDATGHVRIDSPDMTATAVKFV